jgi:hypothetical protein
MERQLMQTTTVIMATLLVIMAIYTIPLLFFGLIWP